MEQELVIKNGKIEGECPKCGKWTMLEFAHHHYGDNFGIQRGISEGMWLCHSCNLKEVKVNPELTVKERKRIAIRDNRRFRRILLTEKNSNRTLSYHVSWVTGRIGIKKLQYINGIDEEGYRMYQKHGYKSFYIKPPFQGVIKVDGMKNYDIERIKRYYKEKLGL